MATGYRHTRIVIVALARPYLLSGRSSSVSVSLSMRSLMLPYRSSTTSSAIVGWGRRQGRTQAMSEPCRLHARACLADLLRARGVIAAATASIRAFRPTARTGLKLPHYLAADGCARASIALAAAGANQVIRSRTPQPGSAKKGARSIRSRTRAADQHRRKQYEAEQDVQSG